MTLEKHEFELQGPLTCGSFSVNTCTVFDPQLGVRGGRGQLYALVYTILYQGLDHLQIWVSKGRPEANAPRIQRDNWCSQVFGDSGVRLRFSAVSGGGSGTCSPPMLFKGQLYIVNLYLQYSFQIAKDFVAIG